MNGQHTFAVDPSIIERERHPSYYGDFAVPVGPGGSNGSAATPEAPSAPVSTGATTRSSRRTSMPSARRAAAVDDEMDTT